MSSFLSLGVPEKLADVLAASGKTEAFPIQTDTLPDSLSGRDVLGRGRTGSGKTIAFAVPLVARLTGTSARPRRPRGLVLAPTRELASQIAATVAPLADAVGLTVTTVFGGVSQRPQEQALARGVDIVVACPGRLEDLMKQGVADLGDVAVTVLDEADHMADLGFLPGVKRIMGATPAIGQRMLFSATLDRGVDTIVQRFLHDAVTHSVDESSVPQGQLTHRVFVVDPDDKATLVRHLASGQGKRILFMRTKHQAKKLAKQLTAAGIPSVDLHGNLSQNARERNLAAFGADPVDGGVRVLVATDVAARGVHVDHVELVVHVDPPVEHKAYLHRSGRTARAGEEGTVVTVTLPEQRRDVNDLLRKAKLNVPFEAVRPQDAAVSILVGEPAPYVTPAPPVAAPARGGSSGKGGSSGRGGSTGRGGSAGRSGSAAPGGRGAHSAAGAAQGGGRRGGRGQRTGADSRVDAPSASTREPRRPRTADAAKQSGQRDGADRSGTQRSSTQRSGTQRPGTQHSANQRSSGQAHSSAPQAGRTASGKPTIGATVGGARSRGSRRASYPGGR
ncbi:DEAD/DEAH box helicase [Microbacterium terrisoli]|uniref:DEAD/DEAH box helicase n=1 Tax=Microbacterium terrisoli TaxID=3242192 RepID=UPI002803DA2F|nr:DEAD/DEAH box helicase [Microbacterium protaetiae]